MKDISVLDLSTRLPGPLATKLLGDLGAVVTKLENEQFPDPFSLDENNRFDQNFRNWHESINSNKKRIVINEKGHHLEASLCSLICNYDIIISSLPEKIANHVLTNFEHNKNKPQAFVQIKSSKEKIPMHDLNILAQSGLLEMHLQVTKTNTLPFLPLAGVIFAEAIAQKAQATYIEALKTNRFIKAEIFLDEVINKHLNFLLTDTLKSQPESHFLHTGKFPCYNIYQLKDQKHLAVAAIETKYWVEFLKFFNLRQTLDQFDPETEKELRRLFINISSNEIQNVDALKNCCVTIF